MNCPKCQHARLRSSSSDGQPPAMSCPKCGGFWLHPEKLPGSIIEQAPSDQALSEQPPSEPSELDLKGGLCPEGHGILIRAHLDVDPPFYLERCSRCLGVWFDAGEWQRLASLHLLQALPELWTDQWQSRQHDEKRRATYQEWIRSTLGPDLVDRLAKLATDLRGHEHRLEALAFLRNESVTDEK